MSNQRDKDREAYYHFAMNNKDGAHLPTALGMRVTGYVQETTQRMQQQKGRVVAFNSLSEAAQREYIKQHYPGGMPRGVGARQGELITLAADEVNDDARFIATDFLIDCHALTLVARDANGRVLRTLLTHIDAMTDIATEVPKLVSRMPAGSRIEATLLGSPYDHNHFIQSDTMNALMGDKRVTLIRHNVDAATTVAIDTTTGRILTAKPRETLETSAHIAPTELPIDITFMKAVNAIGGDYREYLHPALRVGRATSPLELEEVYRAGTGFITETSLVRFVIDRAADGLSAHEVQEITDMLSNKLQQPLRIDQVEPDPVYGARYMVRTLGNNDLGDFTVPPTAAAAPAPAQTAEQKPSSDTPLR